jgi:hypothetical protein
MNDHIHGYYHEFTDDFTPSGHFHRVIPLHEAPDIEWEEISQRVPSLPKGWFELSRLPAGDRMEFVRDFWLSKLPYVPHVQEFLYKFFEDLAYIGIYATQQSFEDPFNSQMVYGLEGNRGFYHGSPPLNENDVASLEKNFEDTLQTHSYMLPVDYTAFLQIHDGFSKYTDTGIIHSSQLCSVYKQFQQFLLEQEPIMNLKCEEINPKALIPFYESFGLHCYQCFWGDWYAEQEMGNVYYSGIDKSMSNVEKKETWSDNMAYPTFLEWLVFYLESIE